MQSLTHKSTNCWSENSPNMTVSSVPIYCEYMSPAKTQKLNLYSFATFKITKTVKRQMSPAQWGDICHPLIVLKAILAIYQQHSCLVL